MDILGYVYPIVFERITKQGATKEDIQWMLETLKEFYREDASHFEYTSNNAIKRLKVNKCEF